MALIGSSIESMEGLFLHQLKDLYDAENQILEALPDMIEAASLKDLRQALKDHQKETESQKERLERIFNLLDKKAEKEKCKGIRGIIKEGQELLSELENKSVRDAGIIAAAQRVEHYEMAGYGTAHSYAQILDNKEIAKLLKQSLEEEKKADQKLTAIAENQANKQAASKQGSRKKSVKV